VVVEEDEVLRAFFAIELGEPARRAAAAVARRLREAPGGDGVRWVRPEALHVTLRFLGDVAAAQTAPLARRAAGELAALAPFALHLGPAALFPTPRRPRVVALGLEPEAPLAALAAALERAVVAEGFAPEPRAFRAHLTLGRVRDRRFPAVAAVAVPAEAIAVEEAVLFRSELRPKGSRYTPLERVRLGSAPGAAATHHPQSEGTWRSR
jgi:2'-5' RNA ligase